MKHQRNGFTLIEMLVVVLIIGILAAIALPRYFNTVKASKLKANISALRPVIEAEKRHKLATGQYQPDIDLLDISVPYNSKIIGINKGTYTTDWGSFLVISSGANMDTLIRVQVLTPELNGSVTLMDPNDKADFDSSIPGASQYSGICIAKDSASADICKIFGAQFYTNGSSQYFGF